MRIAYTLDQVLRCGGVRVVFEHCRELNRRGYDAAIYAAGHVDDDARDWTDHYQVKVRPLAQVEGADVLISVWWRMLDELTKFHVEQRFHLVQGRDILSYPKDHEWRNTIEQQMHRQDYEYLAVSAWAGASCRNPHIVPNGVDTDFWRPAAFTNLMQKFRILIEGSTADRYKGVSEALDVARQYKATHDNVEIWTMAKLEGTPADVDRIIVSPHDVAIKGAYQNATVLLKASHFDGFGLPHLEAMACGLPLVTTDAGGNMSFCVHNQNCLVVPVGDPQSMVAALDSLYQSKALRERLAVNGILTAKKWTWERSVDKLLDAIGAPQQQ